MPEWAGLRSVTYCKVSSFTPPPLHPGHRGQNKRTGHLWQGRFKSWYVTDEAYLYTLMRYIEQNPLKAGMVKEMADYPYSSYHYFLNYKEIPECLKRAWIAQHYQEDKEAIEAFLSPHQ